ncbi:uncharacterized protein LOC141813056 [Curcuma longa]|uniref:uncharacterized protein LOC141813056 n=1 Tax=Curcuma longa TaxID=136217 RepID=UPI003D9E2AC5
MRERAAQQIHAGSLEYDKWPRQNQAWKLESAATIEPPCNFIISSHARGKKVCWKISFKNVGAMVIISFQVCPPSLLSANLQDSKAPKHLVLSSCSVLSIQTLFRRLAVALRKISVCVNSNNLLGATTEVGSPPY